MRHHRLALALLLLLLATGCQHLEPPLDPDLPAPESLLDGARIVGHPVPAAAKLGSSVFELDERMQGFANRWIRRGSPPQSTARSLLMGMKYEGLLNLDYDARRTTEPARTFRYRSGNCLSFTLLFAAFARHAGLPLQVQQVDVPPTWSQDGDLVVSSRHVNLRLPDYASAIRATDVIIDFNEISVPDAWETRIIRTHTLIALFHVNRGVEALAADDLETAFAELHRAVLTDPDLAAPWINLGLIYARHGLPRQALAAYGRALYLDPDDPSTLHNLATLYRQLERVEEAELYAARVRRYRERNPYWHGHLALTAMEAGRLRDALAASARAMALQPKDPELLALRSRVLLRAGATDEAIDVMQQAARLEASQGGGHRYATKLQHLVELAGATPGS